jgi:hypothetical protein
MFFAAIVKQYKAKAERQTDRKTMQAGIGRDEHKEASRPTMIEELCVTVAMKWMEDTSRPPPSPFIHKQR